MKIKLKSPGLTRLIILGLTSFISACVPNSHTSSLIKIQEQGSFAVGGSLLSASGNYNPQSKTAEDKTFHGDHAYVFYQIPAKPKKLPIVFWHGIGQFSKTWESTPDGREGFQNIFLRKGYGVYLLDQPRRGNAGRSTLATTIKPELDEQKWFNTFRVGVWPDYFPNVQFAKDPETLNQYFRQMTPDTGEIDINVNAKAVAALFEKIGDGILVTHSHSGGMGWQTVLKSNHIRAVVSYEPGSNFVFPEGEVPQPIASSSGPLVALGIPLKDFMALTKIPIVIYYGDFIPATPNPNPGQDGWRARLEMARIWANTINKYGGNASVVHLPEVGIYGNTHFPFSDLNNQQIAELMETWLRKNVFNKNH